jgi:ribosome maturation factor RimP
LWRHELKTMTKPDTSLWDLTEAYLVAEHLELDDLEVLGKGRARTVKVVVDGHELDLDRIAEVARGLSRLFDAEYQTEESYQLEVTSPGLERALKRPRHFEKSVGRDVVLKGRRPEGNVITHRGVLVDADHDGVVIRVDETDHRYPYEEVISARTVFRWESSPKPGK